MKHGEICNSCERSLNIYSCGCKQSLKIGFLREKQPSIIVQKDSVLFCFLFMCYRWPFRFWDKNFTKIQKKKNLFILPKPYNFLSLNPSSRKPSRDLPQPRSTTTGHTVYFYNLLIYILGIHRRSFKHSIRRRHYGK